MRTALFFLTGLCLLTAAFLLSKLFSNYYQAASTTLITGFLVVWLALTGFNMWVGVAKAGYSAMEELPIFLLLYGVPAAAAMLVRWKLM